MSEVTRILEAIEQGDANAAEELLPLVYDELRRLAAHKMANEPAGQTLQPTALVHEAWLRVVGGAVQNWNNREHFFRAAAEAMRHILVDRARQRSALRRGGQLQQTDLSESKAPAPGPTRPTRSGLGRSGQAALFRRLEHDGSIPGPGHSAAQRRTALDLRQNVVA